MFNARAGLLMPAAGMGSAQKTAAAHATLAFGAPTALSSALVEICTLAATMVLVAKPMGHARVVWGGLGLCALRSAQGEAGSSHQRPVLGTENVVCMRRCVVAPPGIGVWTAVRTALVARTTPARGMGAAARPMALARVTWALWAKTVPMSAQEAS